MQISTVGGSVVFSLPPCVPCHCSHYVRVSPWTGLQNPCEGVRTRPALSFGIEPSGFHIRSSGSCLYFQSVMPIQYMPPQHGSFVAAQGCRTDGRHHVAVKVDCIQPRNRRAQNSQCGVAYTSTYHALRSWSPERPGTQGVTLLFQEFVGAHNTWAHLFS